MTDRLPEFLRAPYVQHRTLALVDIRGNCSRLDTGSLQLAKRARVIEHGSGLGEVANASCAAVGFGPKSSGQRCSRPCLPGLPGRVLPDHRSPRRRALTGDWETVRRACGRGAVSRAERGGGSGHPGRGGAAGRRGDGWRGRGSRYAFVYQGAPILGPQQLGGGLDVQGHPQASSSSGRSEVVRELVTRCAPFVPSTAGEVRAALRFYQQCEVCGPQTLYRRLQLPPMSRCREHHAPVPQCCRRGVVVGDGNGCEANDWPIEGNPKEGAFQERANQG